MSFLSKDHSASSRSPRLGECVCTADVCSSLASLSCGSALPGPHWGHELCNEWQRALLESGASFNRCSWFQDTWIWIKHIPGGQGGCHHTSECQRYGSWLLLMLFQDILFYQMHTAVPAKYNPLPEGLWKIVIYPFPSDLQRGQWQNRARRQGPLAHISVLGGHAGWKGQGEEET